MTLHVQKGVQMTKQELIKILYALVVAYGEDYAVELFSNLTKHITL